MGEGLGRQGKTWNAWGESIRLGERDVRVVTRTEGRGRWSQGSDVFVFIKKKGSRWEEESGERSRGAVGAKRPSGG